MRQQINYKAAEPRRPARFQSRAAPTTTTNQSAGRAPTGQRSSALFRRHKRARGSHWRLIGASGRMHNSPLEWTVMGAPPRARLDNAGRILGARAPGLRDRRARGRRACRPGAPTDWPNWARAAHIAANYVIDGRHRGRNQAAAPLAGRPLPRRLTWGRRRGTGRRRAARDKQIPNMSICLAACQRGRTKQTTTTPIR